MIDWLVHSLAGFTLMLLLVLAVRRPLARLFGAGWAYAAWLTPLLYLLFPDLSALWHEIALPSVTVIAPVMEAVAAPPPPSGGPGQWVPLMLALWAGGAVIFILWQWLDYRRFLARVLSGSRPGTPSAIGRIHVRQSKAVEGPLAIGLLERLIILPFDFAERYSAAEQRLAIEHERVHHSRGDIWCNLVALVLLACNWFNPVAYLAFRAFRSDQELACDAVVAARACSSERQDYARALIKSASRPGMIAACPLNDADILKRRLKMMKQHRKSGLRTLGGSGAFALMLAVGIGLSGPGFAQEDKAKPERKIVVKEFKGADGRSIARAELSELAKNCPEAQKLQSDVTTGDDKQKHRTRVVICAEDGKPVTPEMREKLVAALERARTEIGSRSEMSPERREEAAAALQREIERVRAQSNR